VVGVTDVTHIRPAIKSYDKMAAAYLELEAFAASVCTVVAEESVTPPASSDVWSAARGAAVLPILRSWKARLALLEQLRGQLCEVVTDLEREDLDGLIAAVKRLHFPAKDGGGQLSGPAQLDAIVRHFMTCFGVTSVNNVITAINSTHRVIGETQNAHRALCTLLGLAPATSSTGVVEVVSALCQEQDERLSTQLRTLLGYSDLDDVRRRLQEHEEFLPAFQRVTQQLMQLLGVERLDLVVPAVRSLKVMAGAP